MSDAMIGWGCTLSLKVGSGSLTEVGEMIAIEPGGKEFETTETTHFKSPDRTREYIKTLATPGTGSFQINWIPGNATDDIINAAVDSIDPCEYEIVYPGTTANPAQQETGEVHVLSRTPTIDLGDRMTCTVNLQFSGTRAQAAAA